MEDKDAGIYNNGVLAWKQRWAFGTFTSTFLKNDDTLFVTFLKKYHRYRYSVLFKKKFLLILETIFLVILCVEQ